MKRYAWIGMLLLVSQLGGCQSSRETPTIITEKLEIPVIYEIPASANVEDYINKESYKKPKGIEEPMEVIQTILESNYEEEIIEVYFDETTGKVTVLMISEGMTDIANLALQQETFKVAWNDLAENFRQLTDYMKQVLEKADFTTDVVFYVLNDYDTDYYLLGFENDTVTYNMVRSKE